MSADNLNISIDEMSKILSEMKILLQPFTMYGEGGAVDRFVTGKTLDDSIRDAKINLYYHRKRIIRNG